MSKQHGYIYNVYVCLKTTNSCRGMLLLCSSCAQAQTIVVPRYTCIGAWHLSSGCILADSSKPVSNLSAGWARLAEPILYPARPCSRYTTTSGRLFLYLCRCSLPYSLEHSPWARLSLIWRSLLLQLVLLPQPTASLTGWVAAYMPKASKSVY